MPVPDDVGRSGEAGGGGVRVEGRWGAGMMILLLLFLQKQNLAFAVYLFGSGSRRQVRFSYELT